MPNTLATALGLKSHNEAEIKVLVIILSQTCRIALEFFVINIVELQLRLKTVCCFSLSISFTALIKLYVICC